MTSPFLKRYSGFSHWPPRVLMRLVGLGLPCQHCEHKNEEWRSPFFSSCKSWIEAQAVTLSHPAPGPVLRFAPWNSARVFVTKSVLVFFDSMHAATQPCYISSHINQLETWADGHLPSQFSNQGAETVKTFSADIL